MLQQMRDQGLGWIGEMQIEMNRKGQPLLRLAAPTARSAEINALLARYQLFAAELHPREGSLEEIFLELTAPASIDGHHPGMAALAEPAQETAAIQGTGTGKRGIQ